MKTVTVRDLRYDFPKVERMLREGKPILITKRGKTVARIEPEHPSSVVPGTAPLPDFLGRLNEIYGDQVFDVSGADLISEDREERF